MRILLRAGARVDAPDTRGNTPLWRAVFESRGRGDTIQALLAAGANPDLPNQSGVTPGQLAERKLRRRPVLAAGLRALTSGSAAGALPHRRDVGMDRPAPPDHDSSRRTDSG
jgi:hypothetical protein